MYGLSKLALVGASVVAPSAVASSLSSLNERQTAPGSWWMANMTHQGSVFGNTESNYAVFRDVRTYGAKGDGVTDDSDAIMAAMGSDNTRCGRGCNSTTTQPAILYFSAGTYLLKKPIQMYYYTQLIGDPNDKPTLLADPSLKAMGMLDSDPYNDDGSNWYINQNNFYRQVRNFVIDVRNGEDTLAGIHWQVAQATSLHNIDFKMKLGSHQKGIFMDNGSGGFMSKLTFDGGLYGAFFGNQQFTTRDLKFTNCDTAVFMNWNWLWNLKSINVDSSCKHAVNMSVGGADAQTVGTVLIQDSVISTSGDAIITSYHNGQKASNGTLVLDNVDFTGTLGNAIVSNNVPILQAGKIDSWIQGFAYVSGSTGNASVAAPADGQQTLQGPTAAPSKSAGLLDGTKFFEQNKPQYETLPSTSFLSARTLGAKGDGVTDDTAALQAAITQAGADKVLFIDHGAYLIKDTLKIPSGARIVGEVWPILLVDGESFNDTSNPKVAIQVGERGSIGSVEMSDLVISTKGSASGATLMEWNIKSDRAGSAGIWDVHWRIGGTVASGQGSRNCARGAAGGDQPINPGCLGVDTMFHMTEGSSGYFENVWWWVADHDLDVSGGEDYQINIWNGRGVLVETQEASWFYGTASEHSQLYNYAFNKASNIYMGAIQTETAYMQGGNGPASDLAFPSKTGNAADPDFKECAVGDLTCKMTWGVRFIDTSNVFVYGAGLYSFFNDYAQSCLVSGGGSDNCQKDMVYLDDFSADIFLYGLSTKAAVNMVTIDTKGAALGANNPSTFTSAVALFELA